MAVNDVADRETLAHLLKYDSTYGRFPAAVEAGDDSILVDGAEIKVFSEADPGALLGELDVDLVIEATGRFRTRAEAAAHLDAGARRAIVSAPVKDPDVTVALGVNFDEAYDAERHTVISNASCTTNCLAPVAKVIHETSGDRPRPDDHDPRLHRRPAAPGHAAQGPAAGAPRGST